MRGKNHHERAQKHDEFQQALLTNAATDWIGRIIRLPIQKKITTNSFLNTTSFAANMTNAEKIIASRGETVTSARKTATNAAAHTTKIAATVANRRREGFRLIGDALDPPLSAVATADLR